MSEQLNLFDDLSFYEGADVEYKAAKGGLPGELWETYSAFANSQGGVIWLGISQKSGRLDIHGVPNPEKLVSDFWNTVNNRGKVNVNLLTNDDVSIVPVTDQKSVVRINVPRADRRQKPVFLGSDPFRGTFRRNYEGDYRCIESEVRRMFADQSDEPADSRILEGFSFEDLHLESLRQFRNRFASRTPHPRLAEDDKGLLEKLGGWRRERASKQEGLTVAGLLMFGRELAIRDPSAVPGFQLDYREHYTDDPAVRWTDRLTLDGTWEGNLFQFYQQVMLKLSTGPGVRRPFQTDAEGYRVTGTPVVEALQEALVNALIHADYAGQGGIVIDRWVDRLEFSNPGTLLVSREQLLRGSVSECRNKSLQLMFQMLGAGDKAGSGIDKIRSSWLSEHWQSPSLSERHGPDRVLLYLPMLSTLPEDALDSLRGRFGEQFENLTPDEVHAVVTAFVEGEVTNLRLQDMLTLHRFDITRMLRGLVHRGLLVSDGAGRGTRYTLPISEGEVATPLSEVPSPLSEIAPPLSESGGDFQREDVAADLKSTDDTLWLIGEPIRNQPRAKPELMKSTILALCQSGFLSLQQLAAILGRRSAEKLRENYVSPLVSEGRLALRYPENLSHSEQAYRTVQSDADKNEKKS